MLFGRFGAMGTLACAMVYGVAALLLGMSVAHDAAHLAVTGRPAIDTAIQRLLFGVLGVDGYLWRIRHDGSHHVFPNVNGCDIDIDENRFLRLSPNHARRPWHRFQHLRTTLNTCSRRSSPTCETSGIRASRSRCSL